MKEGSGELPIQTRKISDSRDVGGGLASCASAFIAAVSAVSTFIVSLSAVFSPNRRGIFVELLFAL